MRFGKKLSAFTDLAVGKYKVKFFRRIGDRYVCIDTVNLKIEDNKPFRYKNQDFNLFNKRLFGWTDGKFNFYAFDFDSKEQLTFNRQDLEIGKVTLEDIDNYVNKGLIRQLVAGLEDAKSPKGQWIMCILFLIVGVLIGYFIGQYITNKGFEDAQNASKTAQFILGLWRW